MKNRRLWGLIPALVIATVVGLSVPAQAATASVSAEGVSGSVNVIWAHASGLNITITLTDTKCNATPARSGVDIFGTRGQHDLFFFTNSSGCHGGARTYSTGYFIEPWNILNIRFCAEGGGGTSCTGYLDNPYT